MLSVHTLTWGIAALAMTGVIARPGGWPEAIWAVLGAAALVLPGLVGWRDAVEAIRRGSEVYLFLGGMMLIAELARQQGLFNHLAARAAAMARGSANRLFALVYGVGVLVTVFLSNDATAVVMTPAVFAAARAARAEPLPYLLICAFIANAASFVLPISNPANFVVFGAHMPPLLEWLRLFTIPSILAIAATFVVLRCTQRSALQQALATDIVVPHLSRGGRAAAWGIGATTIVLLTASAFDIPLGPPTFLAGLLTVVVSLAIARQSPWGVLSGVSWSVLPLVAGLFVLVESLDRTGVIQSLREMLQAQANHSVQTTGWMAGLAWGFGSNIINNLPAGLIAGSALASAAMPSEVNAAVLIGVDLGPNLSVTGSLATILWLVALRREGVHVSAMRFLGIGVLVMPPALLLALAGLLLR